MKKKIFIIISIIGIIALIGIGYIFREDLLPIYQEKDFAKKNITSENYLLQQLKKVSTDEKTLK